jgi:hypothetical protein
MSDKIILSKDYLQTLEDIKQRVKSAQIKAHLAVNKEMLILYWQIGKVIWISENLNHGVVKLLRN